MSQKDIRSTMMMVMMMGAVTWVVMETVASARDATQATILVVRLRERQKCVGG
jgi:hypothetical protein